MRTNIPLDATGKVGFHLTLRDAIQSDFGTNPSAEEIVAIQQHAAQVGWGSIQVGGGTFLDMFQQKGRDSWQQNKVLCDAFPDMKKTILMRGDFGVGYDRRAQDFIDALVLKYAQLGINVISNFHGMDDTRMMRSVADAVKRANDAGYEDIYAQGGLTIEENPNATTDMCVDVAGRNIHNGHKDIYIKCANGKLSPDFVFTLVHRLKREFPEQKIHIHTHNTYGLAYAVYLAAIEAGANSVDVLPPHLADGAAQPNALRLLELIQNHPTASVRERAPDLNIEAMLADAEAALTLRFQYRKHELTYNPRLREAMYRAGVAGGASATLRAMPGLEANLRRVLGTSDWDEMQLAIYEMQERILPLLGYPVQVTPYAKNTTDQAAFATGILAGKPPLSQLTPGNVRYFAGEYGYVSPLADKDVRAQALKQLGKDKEDPFVKPADLPENMAYFRAQLEAAGVENPTDEEVLCMGTAIKVPTGIQYVKDLRAGTLKPQPAPELPQASTYYTERDVIDALGGIAEFESFLLDVVEAAKKDFYKSRMKDSKLPFMSYAVTQQRARQDYYTGHFEDWQQDAQVRVHKFIAEIPDRLLAAGYHLGHAELAIATVEKYIQEKGPGLLNGVVPPLPRMEIYNTLASAYQPGDPAPEPAM